MGGGGLRGEEDKGNWQNLLLLLCVSENCYKCPQRAFYGHCDK